MAFVEAPYANPSTPAHTKRLASALREEEFAVEACWTCAFPLLPVDMIEPFRFVNERIYCSQCVRDYRTSP